MNPKPSPAETGPLTAQRLDKWLWASRFFRTRRLAAEAVAAGHIQVNGRRSKPGKPVRPGDHLAIRRQQTKYHILVSGVAKTRQRAQLAQHLYAETRESIRTRQDQAALAKNHRIGIRYDRGKPGKRDRAKRLKIKQHRQYAD